MWAALGPGAGPRPRLWIEPSPKPDVVAGQTKAQAAEADSWQKAAEVLARMKGEGWRQKVILRPWCQSIALLPEGLLGTLRSAVLLRKTGMEDEESGVGEFRELNIAS